VLIYAPSKINLYLRIKEKLGNNYHSIETVYAGTSLCDIIKISLKKGKGAIALITNQNSISNKQNVIVKVVQFLLKKYNIKNVDVDILLQKNIPIGGGMGGESSNAVFSYFGFHFLLSREINFWQARKEVRQFGTDTLYFLYGGICKGIGLPDRIYSYVDNRIPMPKNSLFNGFLLLIYPFVSTSSAKMYTAYDKVSGNFPHKLGFYNDFEPVIVNKYKKIKIIIDKIEDMGYSKKCGVTGSGSVVYLLLETYKEVMQVWNKLCKSNINLSIAGACAKIVKEWQNIFFNKGE
jgi:4-diphosphocytidyl-2-C-methyl-D-erythritol kinase